MEQADNITKALIEVNKWWKGSFELEYKPREIYNTLNKYMATKQMIVIVGLRRTGKTTLMLKLAKESLAEYGAENIIYFSLDDFKDIKMSDLLKAYSILMNKDLNTGKFLLLLDEIQKLEGWEEQVKRVYDNFKNIKIILSGSESLFIRKNIRESLAGRFFEFKVNPLNFSEFLKFNGLDIKNTALYKEEILKQFNEYILCNGFPEMVNVEKEIVKKYIKENIIDRVIFRDLPQILPIRDVPVLENLYKLILLNPGQVINLNEMASELGAARQTISLYLYYLEKSFLIKKLYNFSKNVRKSERRLKKYYPCIIYPDALDAIEFGRIFECVMVLQLEAEFFWRDAYKDEVDIVQIDKAILPIEIKSSKIETKSLVKFMNKYKVNESVIISYDKEEVLQIDNKQIKVIPFYKFLLEEQ